MKSRDPHEEALFSLRDDMRERMWSRNQAKPAGTDETGRDQEPDGDDPGTVTITIGGPNSYGFQGRKEQIVSPMDDHDEDDVA